MAQTHIQRRNGCFYYRQKIPTGADKLRHTKFIAMREDMDPRGAKSGYWSQEGTVTVIRNGAAVLEDEPISVRGQDTRQDALDSTAWLIVKPITKSFRSASN
jgi:hypothetical protein